METREVILFFLSGNVRSVRMHLVKKFDHNQNAYSIIERLVHMMYYE